MKNQPEGPTLTEPKIEKVDQTDPNTIHIDLRVFRADNNYVPCSLKLSVNLSDIESVNITCKLENSTESNSSEQSRCLSTSDDQKITLLDDDKPADLQIKLAKIAINSMAAFNEKNGTNFCVVGIRKISDEAPYSFEALLSAPNLVSRACRFHLYEPLDRSAYTEMEVHCGGHIDEFFISNVDDDLRRPNQTTQSDVTIDDFTKSIFYVKLAEGSNVWKSVESGVKDAFEYFKKQPQGVALALDRVVGGKRGYWSSRDHIKTLDESESDNSVNYSHPDVFLVNTLFDAFVTTPNGTKQCKLELFEQTKEDILRLNVNCREKGQFYKILKHIEPERCLPIAGEGEANDVSTKLAKIVDGTLAQLNNRNGKDYCLSRIDLPKNVTLQNLPNNFTALLATPKFESLLCDYNLWVPRGNSQYIESEINCAGRWFELSNIDSIHVSAIDPAQSEDVKIWMQKIVVQETEQRSPHYVYEDDIDHTFYKLNQIYDIKRFEQIEPAYLIHAEFIRYEYLINCTVVLSEPSTPLGVGARRYFDVKCDMKNGKPAEKSHFFLDDGKNETAPSDQDVEKLVASALTGLRQTDSNIAIELVRIIPNSSRWSLDIGKRYFAQVEVSSPATMHETCDIELYEPAQGFTFTVSSIKCGEEHYFWYFQRNIET